MGTTRKIFHRRYKAGRSLATGGLTVRGSGGSLGVHERVLACVLGVFSLVPWSCCWLPSTLFALCMEVFVSAFWSIDVYSRRWESARFGIV